MKRIFLFSIFYLFINLDCWFAVLQAQETRTRDQEKIEDSLNETSEKTVKSENPSTPHTFTVASYNVYNWGVADRFIDDVKVPSTMKPESEKKAVLSILKKINPDILAVMEVVQSEGDTNLTDLEQCLEIAGLKYPEKMTVKGEDSRIQNVLFSRYPIITKNELNEDTFDAWRTPPTQKGQPKPKPEPVTNRVERGFINAVIEINPNYQLDIFVAHLKSKRAQPEFNDPKTREKGENYIRRNEAEILRRHMVNKFNKDSNVNLLVVGDLNDEPGSPALRAILGLSKNSASSSVLTHLLLLKDRVGDLWTHFFDPPCSYGKIDHMVVSQGLWNEFRPEDSYIYRETVNDPKELRWVEASDHRPIVATFYVTNLTQPIFPADFKPYQP